MGGAYSIAHAVLHVRDAISEPQPAKFGIIVSRAVGNAVVRNLVRRRYRAVIDQQITEGFHGADVVFRVLPASAVATFDDLQREVRKQLGRVTQRDPFLVKDLK